uniref:PNK FHA domain-containing protein n=1 Tax=Lygus hesperus TaxID=30085 RepID=A0A0K8SS43_LYGHE
MNSSSLKNVHCSLEPEEGSSIRTVLLEHKEETPVGRTPECLIDDVRVSRVQVILSADFSREEVTIKRIGRNPSFLNGSCMVKDKEYTAQNNNILELVENGYKYRVKFSKSVECASPPKEAKLNIVHETQSPPLKKMKPRELSPPQNRENGIEWIETRKALLLCKYGPVNYQIQNIRSQNELFQVAAFDLDGTIIKTKSGKVHPKGPTDWMLWNDKVPLALKKLHNNGYLIVVISNQASLKYHANINPFKSKVDAILEHLDVPMIVMISTDEDFFRKPAPGMWFYLRAVVLGGAECSMEKSFFVGDAAGRVAKWKPGKTKDFSNSDRLFANNIKLDFKTPEAFFLGETEGQYSEPEFIPWDYSVSHDFDDMFGDLRSSSPEVIVMVGLPASGKSTFVKTHLVPKGYVSINRDTLGTTAKCEKLLKECLSSRKKVVVDNTNLDLETRRKIINICQQYNIVPRCFLMDSTFQRCQHNNKFRVIKGGDHAVITPMVMRASLSKFLVPKIEEGFLDIVRVPFIPNFKDDEDRKLYNYHLLVPK